GVDAPKPQNQPQQPQTQPGNFPTAESIGSAMAEAMGVPDDRKSLMSYLKAEENMKAFAIEEGKEPRFFNNLNEKERRQWEARALNSQIAAIKFAAINPEDLLVEGHPVFKFNKEHLRNLFSMPGTLIASAVYVNIIEND